MAEPPLLAGATKVTVAWVFPATAAAAVGAPGTVDTAVGVTLFDLTDATLLPFAFVALTVKVYAVPLVRPVITWLSPVVFALLSTPPAGDDVTV